MIYIYTQSTNYYHVCDAGDQHKCNLGLLMPRSRQIIYYNSSVTFFMQLTSSICMMERKKISLLVLLYAYVWKIRWEFRNEWKQFTVFHRYHLLAFWKDLQYTILKSLNESIKRTRSKCQSDVKGYRSESPFNQPQHCRWST